MKRLLVPILCMTAAASLHAVELTKEITRQQNSVQITMVFTLEKEESVIASSIHTSVDHPSYTITRVHTDSTPIKTYLPALHQSKEVYNHSFTLNIEIAKTEKHTDEATLYLSYFSLPANSMTDVAIPLVEQPQNSITMITPQQHAPATTHQATTAVEESDTSFTTYIQNLMHTSHTWWVQLLLAFLLGLLVSLTPCIYPMIPITIGILHGKGKQSLLYNFTGSLLYGCGMALTFAVLGLLAALAGNTFGNILAKPEFVIGLILFIAYMSLSMIGIIDLYIPRFLQRQTTLSQTIPPFLSAFLFGVISGTISSPCVSPGLTLLLSMVATHGQLITGFIQLFLFGIGLSVPLIVIGTFSSSLTVLPQSGMWMLEVKKFLGFCMFATCFYYLSNIASMVIVYWASAVFLLFMALYYFIDARKTTSAKSYYAKQGITILTLCMTLFFASLALEESVAPVKHISVTWQESYEQAVHTATAEGKKVIIDFWAPQCTMCKGIEKKIFNNQKVIDALDKELVFVKINTADRKNYAIQQQFQVFTQPTILIIEPATQTVLKRWSDEPYSMTPEQFISQTKALCNKD